MIILVTVMVLEDGDDDDEEDGGAVSQWCETGQKKNRRDKKIKGMFDEKVLNLYSRFSHVCFLNY